MLVKNVEMANRFLGGLRFLSLFVHFHFEDSFMMSY